VKNYSMEIIGTQGERVSGAWTGGVKTKVRNSYVTIPVLAAYKLSKRWNLKAGPYVSYLLEGEFSGNVYEGYLREGNPTGVKVEFKDDQTASYDFSNNLRKFQWGAQLGSEWKAFKHLNVYADLIWGLNNIFQKDFKTITFSMYPIYLNIGFGYAF
ncbi:MAG: porin family protein, partial [Bacteroides sp.]